MFCHSAHSALRSSSGQCHVSGQVGQRVSSCNLCILAWQVGRGRGRRDGLVLSHSCASCKNELWCRLIHGQTSNLFFERRKSFKNFSCWFTWNQMLIISQMLMTNGLHQDIHLLDPTQTPKCVTGTQICGQPPAALATSVRTEIRHGAFGTQLIPWLIWNTDVSSRLIHCTSTLVNIHLSPIW